MTNCRQCYSMQTMEGERMLMVIGGFGTAYAHFLGSNGRQLHSGLDELLYSETARMLRERGYDHFHWGRHNTTSNDKLLAFKSGFSLIAGSWLLYAGV